MIKKLCLFFSLLLLFSGCSRFSSKQDPIPDYAKSTTVKQAEAPKKQDKPTSVTTVKVTPSPVILKQQEIEIKPTPQAATSNVVVALLSDADMSYQQGNFDDSVATIERALHIEPRNPLLLYKLAVIRLQQGQPDLAENLAKKSELLAEGNAQLKKKNWLLIAKAREQKNNQQGANAARKRAQQY